MKLLDKKFFFAPPPKKKIHDFISSKQCHFLGFHLRKRRKEGEETTGGGGGGLKKQWKGKLLIMVDSQMT